MTKALDLQTCGSCVVIGAFAGSETAASVLEAYPGSPLAWYVNLRIFRIFEMARVETSPLHVLFQPHSLVAALVALGLVVLVRIVRFRLAVALFANLSFVAALALAHAWSRGGPPARTASLDLVLREQGSDLALVAIVLAAATVAFVTSHLCFLDAISSEGRDQRRSAGTGRPRASAG